MIPATDCWPKSWKGLLDPRYPKIGLGYDVATTTKKKSNPSCLCLTQMIGMTYRNVAAVAFKADDPDIPHALIDEALDLPHGLKVRKLCIDASNERYFATNVKKAFAGRVTTQLIVSGETLTYQNENMNWKTYLGNLLVNAFIDGYIEMPNEEWCKKMIRQVYTDRGTFAADVDEQGNHADYFDALKNSMHGCGSKLSGPAQAMAAGVGHKAKSQRPGIKNPFALLRNIQSRWS